MTLLPLTGHQDARDAVARAMDAQRLPQVLLVTGPDGIGKQRLALWIAQRALCTAKDRPCGACPSCLKVLNLAHPDLHWFVPVPRPKAGDIDKQCDEVAESLEALMAERRKQPLWGEPDGMAIHGIASARLLVRQASLSAVEGGWRVWIIGDAERLVPQESSQEAANALLKLLEEPPLRSLFLLTTEHPAAVLPTIRSRATQLRLRPLSGAELSQVLRDAGRSVPTPAELQRAGGSVAPLLRTGATAAKASASAMVDLAAKGRAAWAERALRQGPWAARGDFADLLDALTAELGDRVRGAALAGEHVTPAEATQLGETIDRLLTAQEQAKGNVNPQLLLAVLGEDIRKVGR